MGNLDVATPDRLMRGPDIRAAGNKVAVEELGEGAEGVLPSIGDTLEAGKVDELWRITFYSAEEGYGGFTASGVQVAPGMAACSNHWPFATRFRIQNDPLDRWLVCTDRGSAVVNRNHLDVFFWTAEEGWAWLQALASDKQLVEVVK